MSGSSRGTITIELRVEGRTGELDATQSLRVLALLAEVARSVAPDDAELPLSGLAVGSALATIEPAGVTREELLARTRKAFEDPTRLTRRLRKDMTDAYRTRFDYGIAGFGMRYDGTKLSYDDRVQARFEQSLTRPTVWASITGDVRNVGQAQSGIYGKIRSELHRRIVNFEAPASLGDDLREALFRRASVSGQAEVDQEGVVKRVLVERVTALGPMARLTDFDAGDLRLDSAATLAALRKLRSG